MLSEVKSSLLTRFPSQPKMIVYKIHNLEPHVLTSEGASIVEAGSHEFRVWEVLEGAGLTLKEIQDKLGVEAAKVGQGKAFRNKWIKKRADGGFERAVGLVWQIGDRPADEQ